MAGSEKNGDDCDSADFEAILGPMPKDGPGLEQHILFLLENPGMNYGNGRKVKFGGHEKQPPVVIIIMRRARTSGPKDWKVSAAIFMDRISHI